MNIREQIKDQLHPKVIVHDGIFIESPTMKVRFPNGEVLTLNRKQRRASKIYNRDLKPIGGK
jgi:hypothetical protein